MSFILIDWVPFQDGGHLHQVWQNGGGRENFQGFSQKVLQSQRSVDQVN